MVTLVRPRSIFLKWRSVIAMPATIAGKYNRSDQVSFGRGTVIAISTPAPPRNHSHARSVSITTRSKFGDRHVSNETTVMMVLAGKIKNKKKKKIRIKRKIINRKKRGWGGAQKNLQKGREWWRGKGENSVVAGALKKK